ncbi:hypothetical protein SLE2022_179160 [Rubroshorea leprosula]
MGGSMVLLKCEDKDLIRELVDSDQGWLDKWFERVKMWSPFDISHERFAWIRIFGLPLHAWNEPGFKLIGDQFGQYIYADQDTSNRSCLEEARLYVKTTNQEIINDSIVVKIKGHNFRMTVSEERGRADPLWWVKGQGASRIKGNYSESSFSELSEESVVFSGEDAGISNEVGVEVEETMIEHNSCGQRLNLGNDQKTYAEICAKGDACGAFSRENDERSGQKKGLMMGNSTNTVVEDSMGQLGDEHPNLNYMGQVNRPRSSPEKNWIKWTSEEVIRPNSVEKQTRGLEISRHWADLQETQKEDSHSGDEEAKDKKNIGEQTMGKNPKGERQRRWREIEQCNYSDDSATRWVTGKKRGNRRKNQKRREESSNQMIVGISLSDSHIEQRNQTILREQNKEEVEKLMELGRRLGVRTQGNDTEIREVLQQMEEVDARRPDP